MSNIAGIDLDKNECRIVVLAGNALNFDIVSTGFSRLGLSDPKDQDQVRDFRSAFQLFLDKYEIDMVAIRERLSKGRMKGGTITFKLEGLIQTCRQSVHLISPASIRKAITAGNIDLTELPIAKFQYEAYGAAYYMMTTNH